MKKFIPQFILSLFCTAAFTVQGQTVFSENFNLNSLPAGWALADSGSGPARWMIHAPATGLATMNGSNFLLVNSDSGGFAGSTANELITSPLIPVNSGQPLFLSFSQFFRKRNNRQDTGRVEVFHNGTWQEVYKISANAGLADAPQTVKLNISAFAGPELRVRFQYKSLRAWYWAIDDVKVFSPFPADIGVSAILSGTGQCGVSLPFSPAVRLKNYGSAPQSGFMVKYHVQSQAEVSEVYSGSLLPGDSALFTFSTAVTNAVSPFQFSSWTSLAADSDAGNDSASVQINLVPAGLGTIEFTDFDGSNLPTVHPGWEEASGLNPQSGSSAWNASTAAEATGLGSATARVNLYTTGKSEWLISPAFAPDNAAALRFKVAVTNWNTPEPDEMGSDDSVIVKVSTDCGQSWQKLSWFTAADALGNQLTDKTVSLAAYAGQAIKVAFYASEGSTDDANDYDFHLDNIRLGVLSPNDLQMAEIILPGGNCGVPASFPVRVRLVNSGSLPQISVPVSYQISGQAVVSQTFAMNLLPGADTILQFQVPVSVASGTNYTISSWVSLPSDGNPQDDSVLAKPFTRAPGTFAMQDFSAYIGDNLGNGWEEFAGNAGELITGSAWLAAAAGQVTALGSETAKVNLYSAFKREWIISPPINPDSAVALRYKIAVTNWDSPEPDEMGSDDSVIVKVSTDCGQSWQNLTWHTASDAPGNQFTDKSVSLAAYTGQTIRLAFYATEGSIDNLNDYDFHLDQIRIGVLSANDLQLGGIQLPGGDCGVPSSFPVRVRLVNSGSLPQTSAPLAYKVTGQPVVNQTFSVSLEPGADTVLEFSAPVAIASGGNYSISAWVSLPGDANSQDDSVLAVPFFRPTGMLAEQGFSGYNGDNLSNGWQEFAGIATQLVSGSAWSSAATVQITGLGSETARVNLYSAIKKEWIISPAVSMVTGKSLAFKVAVTDWTTTDPAEMGSDDSLIVKITTDCGQTWQELKTFTQADSLTNSLTAFSIPLTSYIGQTIRIAFYATEGSTDDLNDYDLHIDDIELINLSPNDVGLSALILPSADCGLPGSLPVKVKLENFGTQSQSGISLGYSVNGGTPVTATYASVLAPGESLVYEFSQPADVSQPGSYIIKAWASITADEDNGNDTLFSVPLSPTPDGLPSVDFSAFDGSNLSSLFPGWLEKSGDEPVGTTSFWNVGTTSQTAGLGSTAARVGIVSNTRREWLISPGFRPAPLTELRFKLALTSINFAVPGTLGSDDSLKVLISTNCGQSWELLEAYTSQSGLTNSFAQKTVNLSAYAGQSCLIGFKATSGTIANSQSNDIHLDDIQTGPLTTASSALQFGKASLRLFPNPVSGGILTVDGEEGRLRFFSQTGMEVFPARLSGNESLFDLRNLPQGLYYIRSESGASAGFVIP